MLIKKIYGALFIMVTAILCQANKPHITLQQIKNDDFDGKFCYVHARGGITPEGKVVITTQPLYLKGPKRAAKKRSAIAAPRPMA